MSPLGLAIGLAVPQGDSKAGQGLAQSVLEGMAAGTFLYVTFLEILPRELASPEAPLAKWSCVAAGFAFMAVIALWAWEIPDFSGGPKMTSLSPGKAAQMTSPSDISSLRHSDIY